MDKLLSIATRIAIKRESLTRPTTEYSTRVEIAFSADFEGTVSKDILMKKLESELISALEASIQITSRELQLRPGRILIKPLRLEIALNDQASFDGMEDEEEQVDLSEEEQILEED